MKTGLAAVVHGLIHTFGHGVWGYTGDRARLKNRHNGAKTTGPCPHRRLAMTPLSRFVAALLLTLLLTPVLAQRMYDGSGHPIGRVDSERFYNGSGQPIGRVDGERVYDGSGRQLGRIDGDRVYSASGGQIGRIDGDRLYSASGSQMGRIDGDRLYDGSGRQIGRADGLRRMQMIVFFYFFM